MSVLAARLTFSVFSEVVFVVVVLLPPPAGLVSGAKLKVVLLSGTSGSKEIDDLNSKSSGKNNIFYVENHWFVFIGPNYNLSKNVDCRYNHVQINI